MNLKGWISWQIILVCAGCVLAGAGVAFVATVHFLQTDMAALAGDLRRKTERVRLLESVVLQQSRSSVAHALDQAPAAPNPEDGGVASAGAGAAPVAAEPAQTAEVAKSSVKESVSNEPGEKSKERDRAREKAGGKAAARAAVQVSSAPVVAVAAAQTPPPQIQPPRAVVDESAGETAAPTAAEVAAVVKAARIEGVSADKAGVERLSANAVHLRGGRTVKVGSLFPSGERLLAVDPENGRIITNQRQVLMFF